MLPASITNSILFFENEKPTEVSRAAVMAYSTLRAVEHYYSDLLAPEVSELLQKYSWIRDQEPARVLKQKRIMSWIISREIQANSLNANSPAASSHP